MATAPTSSRRDVVTAFLPASPLPRHLGIRLIELGDDRAELELPFSEQVTTIGDVVRGGAIGALVDTAAMAAAWSDGAPAPAGGSTVGMTVDFLAPARAGDLRATATVLRRGRSLCFCDVAVTDAAGALVAKALVTYRLQPPR